MKPRKICLAVFLVFILTLAGCVPAPESGGAKRITVENVTIEIVFDMDVPFPVHYISANGYEVDEYRRQISEGGNGAGIENLLKREFEAPIKRGDVIRFEAGDIHNYRSYPFNFNICFYEKAEDESGSPPDLSLKFFNCRFYFAEIKSNETYTLTVNEDSLIEDMQSGDAAYDAQMMQNEYSLVFILTNNADIAFKPTYALLECTNVYWRSLQPNRVYGAVNCGFSTPHFTKGDSAAFSMYDIKSIFPEDVVFKISAGVSYYEYIPPPDENGVIDMTKSIKVEWTTPQTEITFRFGDVIYIELTGSGEADFAVRVIRTQ